MQRAAWGNSSKEPASQVNRGPKKQGRSLSDVFRGMRPIERRRYM